MNTRGEGARGEYIARDYLKRQGYEITDINFSCKLGEIDIIARCSSTLVFVEVKARIADTFGTPAEAVDYHKRRKINAVAAQYIKKFRYFDVPVRFDVIEVFLRDGSVNHIENAFDSYLRY